MGYSMLHLLDWLLWIVMAASVLYALFFALASLLPQRRNKQGGGESPSSGDTHFLVLFPAYKEDTVIVHSVRQCLEQTYPKSHYHIGVISDHMQEETNTLLRQLPITLFTPQFEKSSKAKALQYAIQQLSTFNSQLSSFNYIVILDADNMVMPDFLEQLNASCQQGYNRFYSGARCGGSDWQARHLSRGRWS